MRIFSSATPNLANVNGDHVSPIIRFISVKSEEQNSKKEIQFIFCFYSLFSYIEKVNVNSKTNQQPLFRSDREILLLLCNYEIEKHDRKK